MRWDAHALRHFIVLSVFLQKFATPTTTAHTHKAGIYTYPSPPNPPPTHQHTHPRTHPPINPPTPTYAPRGRRQHIPQDQVEAHAVRRPLRDAEGVAEPAEDGRVMALDIHDAGRGRGQGGGVRVSCVGRLLLVLMWGGMRPAAAGPADLQAWVRVGARSVNQTPSLVSPWVPPTKTIG